MCHKSNLQTFSRVMSIIRYYFEGKHYPFYVVKYCKQWKMLFSHDSDWEFPSIRERFSALRKKWSVSHSVESLVSLCNPMDCNPAGSSVHGILQARILEWVAISFSRESSWPRDRTWVSWDDRRILYHLSPEADLTLKGWDAILTCAVELSFCTLTGSGCYYWVNSWHHILQHLFSKRGDLKPQGTSDSICRHFCLSWLRR